MQNIDKVIPLKKDWIRTRRDAAEVQETGK